jgi:hypothetical protein
LGKTANFGVFHRQNQGKNGFGRGPAILQDGIKVYPQRPLLFTPSPPVVHTQIPGAFDLWFINEMQHFR